MTIAPAAANAGRQLPRARSRRRRRGRRRGRSGRRWPRPRRRSRRPSTAACGRPSGPRRSSGARRPGSSARRAALASRHRPGRWLRRHLRAWPARLPAAAGARSIPTLGSVRSGAQAGGVRARTRSCSACTARSTSSAAIDAARCGSVEVEIISMLTPLVGQGLEHRGGDARVGLHAGADERDLGRCRSSWRHAAGADLGGHVAGRPSRPRPCRPWAR